MSARPDFVWNSDYVDWGAYLDAVSTPAPALTRLPDYDSSWRTMGGRGWGFGDEIERQRAEAARLRLNPIEAA